MTHGVPKDFVTSTPMNKAIHERLGTACVQVLEKMKKKHPALRLIYQTQLTQKEWLDLSGNLWHSAEPLPTQKSGHFWLLELNQDRKIPLVCFYSWQQGLLGNAVERWHSLNTFMQVMGSQFSFVTFFFGEGARHRPNHPTVMIRTINLALLAEQRIERTKETKRWNHLYRQGLSVYRKVDGLSTKQLEIIVQKALEDKIYPYV